jgi:hypothetical protein
MPFKSFLAKLNRRGSPIFPKFSPVAKIIFFSLIVVSVSLFAIHALAVDSVLRQTIDGMQAGGNLESWLGKDSLRINTVGMLNALTDIENAPPEIINGTTSLGKPPLWIPGGMVGSVTSTIAYLYNPPASGIEYLAQMKDNFLGKPAYAQGIGFVGLQPILPIWRAFRNVIYILSSLIFIIIGLMIMLRVKVSPQAVINVQNAIPKLITALILVTFSYAIAGLVIDLMYVIQGLVLAVIFSGVGKGLSANLLNSPLISSNFANLSTLNLGTTFWLSIKNISMGIVLILGGIIGGVLGSLITLHIGVGTLVGIGIGSVLFALIVTIFIISSIIKFLFGLIKCYVTLIIKIITGPLEIGMGAFPNSKMGFSTWLMDVIANAAVFPISLIFLVLVNVIAESSSGLWAPSIIGFTGTFLPFIIAIGGLMLLPKLPEMIPQYVFMLKPSPWGAAIGESFSNNFATKSIQKTGQMAWAGAKQVAHDRMAKVAEDDSSQEGGFWDKFAKVMRTTNNARGKQG